MRFVCPFLYLAGKFNTSIAMTSCVVFLSVRVECGIVSSRKSLVGIHVVNDVAVVGLGVVYESFEEMAGLLIVFMISVQNCRRRIYQHQPRANPNEYGQNNPICRNTKGCGAEQVTRSAALAN